MSRRAPPPSSTAPVSKDVVAIVKKKIAAPSGPPPAGMANFKVPKSSESYSSSQRERDFEDSFDEEESSFDYTPVKSSRNRYEADEYEDDDKSPSHPRQGQSQRFQDEDDADYEEDRDAEADDDERDRFRGRENKAAPSEEKSAAPPKDNPKASSSEVPEKSHPPGKLAVFNFQPILKATYRELKSYVARPCEPGFITRCYIERNRSGANMLAPFYSLCADLEDGTGRELLVCKKIFQSRSPHYVFSLKSDDLYRTREQRSRLYLGKLRGISSSEYLLYDDGICDNPGGENEEDFTRTDSTTDGDSKREQQSKEQSLYRKELASIFFNTKSRPPPTGVRGMEVCIPYSDGEADSFGSAKPPTTVQVPFERIRTAGRQNEMNSKKFFILHERTSRYDPLSSCLVDFRGRANIASVKNFQIVESHPAGGGGGVSVRPSVLIPEADKDFLLQMGKTTEDCFNMDFKHPMSMLQAFAICVARFDSKLTW